MPARRSRSKAISGRLLEWAGVTLKEASLMSRVELMMLARGRKVNAIKRLRETDWATLEEKAKMKEKWAEEARLKVLSDAAKKRPNRVERVERVNERVVWSVELHGQFVEAVDALGMDKATPKRIVKQMCVEGMKRSDVVDLWKRYKRGQRDYKESSKKAETLVGSYRKVKAGGKVVYEARTDLKRLKSVSNPHGRMSVYSFLTPDAAAAAYDTMLVAAFGRRRVVGDRMIPSTEKGGHARTLNSPLWQYASVPDLSHMEEAKDIIQELEDRGLMPRDQPYWAKDLKQAHASLVAGLGGLNQDASSDDDDDDDDDDDEEEEEEDDSESGDEDDDEDDDDFDDEDDMSVRESSSLSIQLEAA